VTTRTSRRAAEIHESFLRGPLVQGEVHLEVAIAHGLRLDRALQRDRTVLFPLAYRALRDAESSGRSGLGTTEISNDVGLSHSGREYSMLNLGIKDAVQTVPYAQLHMETMGDRIRQLRKARNLTQEEFAKSVGVTKSAVSQWEDGSTKNLKLDTFLRVLETLGTDAEFLIFGPDRGGATKRSWKTRTG
jgi:DNA-binding transcriptional regulator YiaG